MPVLSFLFAVLFASSTTVSGTVGSMGSDGAPYMMPGATVSLNTLDGRVVSSTVTDGRGDFRFNDVEPNAYTLRVEMPGFRTFEEPIKVSGDVSIPHQIRLALAGVTENVEVTAESSQLPTDSASISRVVSRQEIETVPLKNEQFIDTLPLVPGVVRGPDGHINVKGARSNQSDLRVNSSAVADPVTGEYGFRLPVDVIDSVETTTNSYSAEFGSFSSGVTQIHTRAGQNNFHFGIQNVFPRPRTRSGSIVGLDSFTPRMTVSGPIIPDKLFYLQSFEYKFDRTRVPAQRLPELKNDTIFESLDSFTQLDYEINALHHLSTTFSLFPEKNGFIGLNTFNAEETTHDFRQRGMFFAISERAIFGSSLLETTYSVKKYDANVRPNGSGIMFLAPAFNSGGFFNRQDRESTQHQWSSTYSFAPIQAAGRHAVRIGTEIKYNTFNGRTVSTPVEILSSSGAMLERIDFTGDGRLYKRKTDAGMFAQDNWEPTAGVALQLGVRYDHDSAIHENDNIAPRFGFAFSRLNDGRTVIRGGVGLFYSRVPINATVFDQMQQRVVTRLDIDGENAGGPLVYRNTLRPAGLRTPYAASWNVEVGHQIVENLVLRVGVQQRNGRRDLIVEPVNVQPAALVLDNRGSSRYREFSATASYRVSSKHELLFSYVRSRSIGDLNDFNTFFGNDPRAIIRTNQRSLLPFDAPQRFLFWGTVGLPHKITVAPLLEVRSGFPYSMVDQTLNFVGQRNRAGRFPTFASLDLQVLRSIKIPMLHKSGQIGLQFFNITGHSNPRDIQNNLAATDFGAFSNSIGRRLHAKFKIDF